MKPLELTLFVVMNIFTWIRNGKRIPTIVGATLGIAASLGVTTFFQLSPVVPILSALVCGFVGAGLAGMSFPRPVKDEFLGGQADWTGGICQVWTSEDGRYRAYTVLLGRAVYLFQDTEGPFQLSLSVAEILEKLARGIDPQISGASLIRVEALEQIELSHPKGTDLEIVYRTDNDSKRCETSFASDADRDAFLAELAHKLGGNLVQTEQPKDSWQAAAIPVVVLALVLVATFGSLAMVGERTVPEGFFVPPVSKFERVLNWAGQVLNWAGPLGIFLVGGILAVGTIAWLIFAVVQRGNVQILKLAGPAANLEPGQKIVELKRSTTLESAGVERGLRKGIEVLLKFRFGDDGLKLMPEIRELHSEERLTAILEALPTVAGADDVRRLWPSGTTPPDASHTHRR
jgi:hypothetical protein